MWFAASTGSSIKILTFFNLISSDCAESHQGKTSKDHVATTGVFEANASIYIWKRNALIKNKKLITNNTSYYLMPYERSIDIDDEVDYKIVKCLLK